MAANGSTVFAEATRQGVLIDRGVGTNRVRRAPIAVDVTGIGAAERALNNLARNRATAIRVTVSTGVRVAGFTGQGGTTFQHGTDFAPGGVALVGEEGPELVEIPRGSRVHDASMTRAILANPSASVTALPRAATTASGGGNYADMSRLVAREVGHAIDGATLIIDDRGRGRLIARESDLYARAG